jgi:outer membrane protein assembly factor BamB
MYLGGPSRNAVVRSKNALSSQPKLKWKKTCKDFGDCSPQDAKVAGIITPFERLLSYPLAGFARSVVVADRMVFHAREKTFALDLKDGTIKWSFPGGAFWSWLQSPIYLAGSLLIVDSEGIFPGRVNSLDPKQWVYWRGKVQDRAVVNPTSPITTMGAPIATRGRLFAYMPYDENVRVVEAKTWETVCTTEPVEMVSSALNGPCYPVGIASDERLLFSVLGSGKLIAVDPLSCTIAWSVDGPICSLPVYSDGAVFVREGSSHQRGVFVSMDAATGKVLWRQKPDADLEDLSFSPPLVVSGRQLLITATRRLGKETSRDELLAFDASSGEALWTLNLEVGVSAGYTDRPWDSVTPPLVHSTFAYIGVADELVSVDLLARKVAWREKLSCGVAQALAMGEGLLFVSDVCGNLYAYGPSTGK